MPNTDTQITEVQKIINGDPKHERTPFQSEYEAGSAFTQGSYRPIAQGVVPIQDAGFIHADAAYDVVSASGGYMFRMSDHLERFKVSCEKFALENPYSDDKTVQILHNLVRLTGLKDAYIWWAVTRGQMAGGDRTRYVNQFYAFVTPYAFIQNDEQRVRGTNLVISDFVRIPPSSVDPKAKNFHWMDMKLSIFDALSAGADWSVLTDGNGNLTEAPGSNIFLIKDRVVRTPAVGCLEGITRKTVFELAAEIGLAVDVGTVTVVDLMNADEAFLSSTAGGVMPVSSVNDKVLGGHAGPGEITTRLHNLYWQRRWSGWLGDVIDYTRQPELVT